MSTDSTHTIQFCCGTSCDAQANLEYVKALEQDRHMLRDDLASAERTIRLLHRRVDAYAEVIALAASDKQEIINGLIKGHTKGAT